MKSKTSVAFERVTNIAVIAAAAVILLTYFGGFRTSTLADRARALRGSRVDLTKFDGPSGRLNVLLGLSTSCHFCEEESDFYKSISQLPLPERPRLLAVFPQQKDEATRYLESHGIRVDDVRSDALTDYRIGATPTILIVDAKGTVTNAWVGQLDPAEKSEVMDRIRKGSHAGS